MQVHQISRKPTFEVVPLAEIASLLGSAIQIPEAKPRNKVLSISRDRGLAMTRYLLLTQAGLQVSSATTLADATRYCSSDTFDLVVIGHSAPHKDKKVFLAELRKSCTTPVLALYHAGEPVLEAADYTLDSSEGPTVLLEAVKKILKQERKP